MLGLHTLLIFQASLGLVCCRYYSVSTEKVQDLNTGPAEEITEVEGYGPAGPLDQPRPGPAPVPIEVWAQYFPPLVGFGGHSGNF